MARAATASAQIRSAQTDPRATTSTAPRSRTSAPRASARAQTSARTSSASRRPAAPTARASLASAARAPCWRTGPRAMTALPTPRTTCALTACAAASTFAQTSSASSSRSVTALGAANLRWSRQVPGRHMHAALPVPHCRGLLQGDLLQPHAPGPHALQRREHAHRQRCLHGWGVQGRRPLRRRRLPGRPVTVPRRGDVRL